MHFISMQNKCAFLCTIFPFKYLLNIFRRSEAGLGGPVKTNPKFKAPTIFFIKFRGFVDVLPNIHFTTSETMRYKHDIYQMANEFSNELRHRKYQKSV